MVRNVGAIDAMLRGVLAALLVLFGVILHESQVLSFAAILLGIVLMATALTRECPLYRLLHIGTRRPPSAGPAHRT
ncbi:MAG: DUF2892 domain-containing protein [Gemmatimonadota bacterium]|nr:DUF2892 domain-containing protein [Gemmatimonadota bacterium]